ncbi:MAG: Ltp family lipoprotein, partial [Brachybacterium sp.]|nr:Ltp family lipoprotein [Brachybacterium sp.]
MSSTDPQGQNQPQYDPSSAQNQFGAPYGAAPGQTAPGAPGTPKKGGKGKFIALGCGILALLMLVLLGGCAALIATSGDDSEGNIPAPESSQQGEAPAEDEDEADAEPAEQEEPGEDEAEEDASDEEAPAEDSGVPADHKSALTSAETYSDMMDMSKKGIFEQLTSEYGDQFSDEAAQYAIDTIDADWNENALGSAESYSDLLHMSKQGIFEQLISESGDQFTEEQAQYAIDTIDADWNENA